MAMIRSISLQIKAESFPMVVEQRHCIRIRIRTTARAEIAAIRLVAVGF